MARYITWQIPFTSDDGTAYTINIYSETSPSSVTVLSPSMSPIVTSLDDNDDFFKPVRLGSGYINFIGGGSAWKSLIPSSATERYVTLVSNSTIKWHGYIQPQTFQAPWGNVVEHQLPICCPLTILQGVDFDTTDRGTITFAQFILDCINNSSPNITTILFPASVGSLDSFLRLMFQRMNFIDTNEEEDGTITYVAKDTYFGILESFCKFWGLTAYVNGTELVFDNHSGNSFSYCTINELTNLATYGTTIPSHTRAKTTEQLDTLDFAGTDGSISVIQGAHKVVVSSDINAVGTIIDFPMDNIDKFIGREIKVSSPYPPMRDKWEWVKQGMPHITSTNDIEIELDPNGGIGYGEQIFFECRDSATEEEWSTDPSGRHKRQFNWDKHVVVQSQLTQIAPNYHKFVIRAKKSLSFSDGYIYIDAEFSHSYVKWVNAFFRIGNKYWNGSSWANYTGGDIPVFSIYTDTADGSDPAAGNVSAFKTTKQLTSNDDISGGTVYENCNDARGYCMLVPANLVVSGDLEFGIAKVSPFLVDGFPQSMDSYMTSLRIGFARKDNGEVSDKNTNTYTEVLNNGFTDEINIANKFASDKNNQAGWGIILNADGSWVDSYRGERPELSLLDMMTAHYDKTAQKISATVKRKAISDKVQDSGTYAVLSFSNDWIHDELTFNAQTP